LSGKDMAKPTRPVMYVFPAIGAVAFKHS
jgi:hypothetical protein